MNAEMKLKLEELLKDEDYTARLFAQESAEIAKELESKGIELSEEAILKISTLLKKKKNGELTDEELEEVSGGFIVVW